MFSNLVVTENCEYLPIRCIIDCEEHSMWLQNSCCSRFMCKAMCQTPERRRQHTGSCKRQDAYTEDCTQAGKHQGAGRHGKQARETCLLDRVW